MYLQPAAGEHEAVASQVPVKQPLCATGLWPVAHTGAAVVQVVVLMVPADAHAPVWQVFEVVSQN